ncbi:MAG: hypothetical protein J0L92_09380 [Deltaproteobacteria bacterium]|nr:hypothetical protein [Deltaproteobacteria bacterium]
MTSWLAEARRGRADNETRWRPSRRAWMSLVAVGGLAIVTGTATNARATVMVEVPFDRLAREADVIVHGRVLRTGSRLVMDGSGAMPHTLTELDVFEPIKGEPGARIVIDELGGEVQGHGTWIEGTPRFRRGEECIVFLRALPDGSFRTYAMAQGHFEVRPGVTGVAPTVVRDTSAMGLVSWVRDTMTIQPGRVASMPLAAFLDYVRDLAEATGGAR